MDFGVLFRRPAFPVVGLAGETLFSAPGLKTLASLLVDLAPSSGEDIVKVVDSTGEEFWYSRERHILSPGFSGRRWTKRQIIGLYNNHVGNDRRYPAHSLSNKRLSEIVAQIADLIRKPVKQFTDKQGQYLSFIYYYSKINGYPPAEADIQKYFKVMPPAVHQMIRTLEKRGLIQKVPHEPRTIRVLVSPKELPELE